MLQRKNKYYNNYLLMFFLNIYTVDFSVSNTDGLFNTAVSNSFLGPLGKI